MAYGATPRSKRLHYDFDEDGPLLASVRLLSKTPAGFAPKARSDIESELAQIFQCRFDCSVLSVRLDVVCRSLNQGDLAKAAIATQFLDLPRALEGSFAKASVDDPDHPGWPKDAPDGKGGEFRPRDDAGFTIYEGKSKRIARRRQRRSFRSILSRVLNAKRVLRTAGEWIGDLIPGVDAVAGPASIVDDVKLLEDIANEVRDSQAALDFAELGPRDLQDLLLSEEEASFSSYSAFVKLDLDKRFGPAGDGYQYHHIVEQSPNATLFSQEILQSTSNIVRIPTAVHEEISSLYGQMMDFSKGRMPLREFLRGASYDQQRAWGLWALRRVGALK